MDGIWSLTLRRSEWEGHWHVGLYGGDDDDIVLSGTVRCYDGESFTFFLEERPPTLSDDLALRVLVAMFEYLDQKEEVFQELVSERVELWDWLKAELGLNYADEAWQGLNEAHTVTPPEAPAEIWWFSWEWLGEADAEGREACVRLWRGAGSAMVETHVQGKIARNGYVIIEQVLADDLLLGEWEMTWFLSRLVQRFWGEEGAQEHGWKNKVEYLPHWLARRRGKRGQWVWNLMCQALRTFGNVAV